MVNQTDSKSSIVPVIPTTVTVPNSPTPTLLLPDEVVIQILNHLNVGELATCGLVCRQLSELSQDNFLWKDLFKSMFPSCNPSGIADFRKACQDQLLYRNMTNGVYASQTLTGHKDVIRSLVVADGKLFSGSGDKTIMVWDIETGNCSKILGDKTIRVWDIKTGSWSKILIGHTDGITSLVFADGKLFSGSDDRTIRVWDIETGNCSPPLTGHPGSISSLAFADGKLFSGSWDTTIRVWDFKATNDAVFEEIANLFMNNDATAMDRFKRMPEKKRNEVYGELYQIIKSSLSKDYFGCAGHAFHNEHGLSSTPQQKAQAIQNYLNPGSKK